MSYKKLYFLIISILFSLCVIACGDNQETISYLESEYDESEVSISETLPSNTDETLSASLGAKNSAEEESKEEVPQIYISVLGEVIEPGVYILKEGSRVYEAINMAGGVTENANVYAINLVKPLEDGIQIIVPAFGEEGYENDFAAIEEPDINDGKVDINKASLADLKTLTGIGDVRAQAILDYRDTNGPFSSIEDLMKVSGIKESTFEKIKDEVCVR